MREGKKAVALHKKKKVPDSAVGAGESTHLFSTFLAPVRSVTHLFVTKTVDLLISEGHQFSALLFSH